MVNTIEPHRLQWPVCGSIVLAIVMFVVLLHWPLQCLWFYYIGHCNGCGSIVLTIVMCVVLIEPQTLQWPIQ
jgi:hypothetical protein